MDKIKGEFGRAVTWTHEYGHLSEQCATIYGKCGLLLELGAPNVETNEMVRCDCNRVVILFESNLHLCPMPHGTAKHALLLVLT